MDSPFQYSWPSLVAQLVKNPPAVQETWVQSLGWEDPLEKGMATHSSNLAWRISWTEEPGRLQSMGLQGFRVIEQQQSAYWGFPGGSDRKEFACNAGDPGSIPGLGRSPREGNGYLLQYSCVVCSGIPP